MSWTIDITHSAGKIVADNMDAIKEFACYEASGDYAGSCVSLRLWADGTLFCDEQHDSNSFPAGEHYVIRRLEGYPDDEPVDVSDILPDVVSDIEARLVDMARHDSRIELIMLNALDDDED